jgi:hypothetical protein
VTGDRRSGRLLGAQIVGPHNAQVATRIDIFAAALHCELRVEQLLGLDLSYTPPFAAPWDAVQAAAEEWLLLASKQSESCISRTHSFLGRGTPRGAGLSLAGFPEGRGAPTP